MAGISSLLKSAQATQKKIRAQQDAEVAYEWDLSEKTYDQYLSYKQYLDDTAKNVSDPSELLSYKRKANTAYSGYVSNEIQRQSINVIEGRGSNTDKYNTMYGLYDAALKNGNYDLAQSLNLQLDNLSVKIQNEQESAQRVAGQMAAYQVKSVKALVGAMKKDMIDLGRLYQDSPDRFDKFLSDPEMQKNLIASNPALEKVFAAGGKISFWDIAKGAADQIKETYQQAINTMPPEDAADFQEQLDKINFGEASFKIPGVGNVSYDDLVNQADAARAGGTYFYKSVDENGKPIMKGGALTNYTWAQDENGQYRLIKQWAAPNTSGQQNPFTNAQNVEDSNQSALLRRDGNGNLYKVGSSGEPIKIGVVRDGQYYDTKGNLLDEFARNKLIKDSSVDYKTILGAAGYNVKDSGNGYILTGTAASQNIGDIPGLKNGQSVKVVVDPSGNLRYVTQDENGNEVLQQLQIDNLGQIRHKTLNPGEQGSISANDQADVAQTQKMLKQDTGSYGHNKGNESLSSTLDVLKLGDNFTHGKLQDPLFRAQWIKQGYELSPEQMLANAQRRGDQAEIQRLQTDIARTKLTGLQRPLSAVSNAAPAVANYIQTHTTSTPGMAAANRSVQASAQKILNTPAKYGVFANSGFGDAFKKYFADYLTGTQKNFSTQSIPAKYVVSNANQINF